MNETHQVPSDYCDGITFSNGATTAENKNCELVEIGKVKLDRFSFIMVLRESFRFIEELRPFTTIRVYT
jgi:hypothetical protein